ncbi:urease accessory protein UreE [Helicobacter hepaticus]|jgi:urease accessory protein|uniref:Urease accessory protein UreE n=1 Tax=Helicobacter hepaticus (strain ATCC 51449 / 3B1) TaxID=235279 RepID=UREE_HELHP|nr:urease accessory protein UreE [Helicobacter hepaticus]Q7VJ36.2 RecName: Full=Urease accessory protein UreE [Helicobacter hepaticus ATCC 51449]AAK69201.1 urease accessory protein UreE [Helicobacter hepaticus]
MRVEHIIGNIKDIDATHLDIDEVQIAWYDTKKKIARLNSQNGQVIAMKLAQAPKYGLNNGDILFLDEHKIIIISILPTWVLCMKPTHWHTMARLCYEIGNLHIPLFYNKDTMKLQAPFEQPLQRILEKQSIAFEKKWCVLDSKDRINITYPIASEPKLIQSPHFSIKITQKGLN